MNAKATNKTSPAAGKPLWLLCLYVADRTPKSVRALQNLTAFCEKELSGRYKIEVVDVMTEPGRARTENIIALPTLVRKAPQPMRRVIGDLSNTQRLVSGLDVRLPA